MSQVYYNNESQKAKATCTAWGGYLIGDVVNVLVLLVDLVAHVLSHCFQVANDASHRIQVLLHLILTGIVGYPVDGKKVYTLSINSINSQHVSHHVW